ncbi:hypothetical protein BO94DRAFT_601945 [Aspergillus sclerotioniger CBS 115572]|uniref:Alpha/beta-hydrolase n=1 Tax=Aspergillus sclerotioniger CBS 115572 TaxID=1450535 RepID=A0A317W415_9EURO|nr:hypothetical protein BO94DRAFT_601945 [Aspergillus sclerotioniger CBS 115572]PWY80745.1 hypothetical protein BO94DRAFT_601945 [Aspergillus sclerotioniger CBS 115572]
MTPDTWYHTVRVSCLPPGMSKEEFGRILSSLPHSNLSDRSQDPNVCFWSLTSPVSGTSQCCIATVTFSRGQNLRHLASKLKEAIGDNGVHVRVEDTFLGPTPLIDPGDLAEIDIIAIHGFDGHAFKSWAAEREPTMWLRDFLPEAIPKARIITYGYAARLLNGQSEASLGELADDLRRMIHMARPGQAVSRSAELNLDGSSANITQKHRPLILIDHDLGGLIIKMALVQASEAKNSDADQAFFVSSYAVVFFGVPQRGFPDKSITAMAKGQPNEKFVRSLVMSSDLQTELRECFNNYFQLPGSQAISLYETMPIHPIKIVIPAESAIFTIAKDNGTSRHLPINANHYDMIRFNDKSSFDYDKFVTELRKGRRGGTTDYSRTIGSRSYEGNHCTCEESDDG